MSKEALTWYRNQQIADASLKSLLHVLAFEAKKGTGDCGKPQALLAEKTGMTDRAIRTLLVILERLEVITRTPRNKGRYGRTADLITLSMGRNFDVSRGSIQAIRKALKPTVPPEPRSASTKSSHRNHVPLPPEPRSGESYKADTEDPYQVRVSTEVEGSSATSGDARPADRASPDNVILLARRGAA